MADKALKGNRLTRQRRMEQRREAGPSTRKEKRKGYRIDPSLSPVAKSRVIDRMKEEAKAMGGSFFTAEEMEQKIAKMKKTKK